MKSIASILAAVDFSDDSRRAALRAALIASALGVRVELLCVMNETSLDSLRRMLGPSKQAPKALRESTEATLSALAAEVSAKSGLEAARRVEVGDVLDAILAASSRADLLAIGARGLNPLRDLIIGSTAARLLGKCREPVLVVRRAPRGPYRRVLVPVDFSAHSAPALRLAGLVAPGAEITVFHAFAIPFEGKLRYAGVSDDHLRAFRAKARSEAIDRMRSFLVESGGDRERTSHAVASGSAGQLILAKEKSTGADLVVVGKQGHSRIEELLLGSVTRHVLADSRADVLVVQGPASGA